MELLEQCKQGGIMRTLTALAIAYAGYRAAQLFVQSLSFPWLGVAVFCLAVSIAVLTANPTTYRS